MHGVAPPGELPTPTDRRKLARLTAELLASTPDARAAYRSFVATAERWLDVDRARLADALDGRRVLVTGGTGCIGSQLLSQLGRFKPASLTSLSRRPPAAAVAGVRYLRCDVSDSDALRRVFARVEPDIVFHLAAQRDPGVAETSVAETVATNVFGTLNVVEASSETHVEMLVYASSGKAMRPFTSHVYASTKRVAEWIVSSHGRPDLERAVARFTHVVDNSLVPHRIAAGCRSGIIRIHDPGIALFAQSALESSQLLLVAAVEACAPPGVRLVAMEDFGPLLLLLEVALGGIAGFEPLPAIHLSGYEAGYEAFPYPGLYLPETAVDTSPLLSAFEAAGVDVAEAAPGVQAVAVPAYGTRVDLEGLLSWLRSECLETSADRPRAALASVAERLLRDYLSTVPRDVLAAVAARTATARPSMTDDHRVIDDAIRDHLNADAATVHGSEKRRVGTLAVAG